MPGSIPAGIIRPFRLMVRTAASQAANAEFKSRRLPGTVPEDRENDPAGRDEDIKVMKAPRFLEIFHMVDYSICNIEVDKVKKFTKRARDVLEY